MGMFRPLAQANRARASSCVRASTSVSSASWVWKANSLTPSTDMMKARWAGCTCTYIQARSLGLRR